MRGILEHLSKTLPAETVENIKAGFDSGYKFFNHEVSTGIMFLIVIITILVLFGVYLLIVTFKNKTHSKTKMHFANAKAKNSKTK